MAKGKNLGRETNKEKWQMIKGENKGQITKSKFIVTIVKET